MRNKFTKTLLFKIPDEMKNSEIYQDKVMLENNNYEKIFGHKFKKQNNLPWKKGIVKLKVNGKVIRRMFASGNKFGIRNDEAGFTGQSMSILGLKIDKESAEEYEVTLSRGSKLFFFWQHPLHEVRVAFKLGIVSLALGLLGFGKPVFMFVKEIAENIFAK